MMYKILLTLAFWQTFLLGTMNEKKVDVFFANGILTRDEDAFLNAQSVLKPAIIDKVGIEYFNQYIEDVGYAYNNTYGFLPDILESSKQIQSKLLSGSAILSLVSDYQNLQSIFTTLAKNADLSLQIKQYQESIENGHRVLVVAHSQGNLFTEEAYRALGKISKNGWMQNYFEAISVASPAFYDIKPGTKRIDWDNDLVARLANLGFSDTYDFNNNVRSVSWVKSNHNRKPNRPASVPKPAAGYVEKNNVGSKYKKVWTASEGIANLFDSNVHAFSFYMGEALVDNGDKGKPFIDPFTGKKLVDSSAKKEILNEINDKINILKALPSQWKKSKDLNCPNTCAHRIKLTHKFDPALDIGLDAPVIPFDTNGKVYMVDGKYVMGDPKGTGITEIKDGTVCYELNDTAQKTYGKDIGPRHTGALEITLNWARPSSEYNLSIGPNADGVELGGSLDQYRCREQHYYVEEENMIFPGTYEIAVAKNSVPDAKPYDTLSLRFKVPNIVAPNGKVYRNSERVMVFHDMDVNGGGIADIIIKETKGGHMSVYMHPGSMGGGAITSRCQPGTPEKDSCGCIPCQYQILNKLSKAYLGPLAGADFSLYERLSFLDDHALFKGQTVDRDNFLDTGRMRLPFDVVDNLDDEKTYIFEVSGGMDIDADDDFVEDAVPTPNKGVLHAIVPGSTFKTAYPNVNILTEITWQLVRNEMYDLNRSALERKLDEIARRLLRSKVHPASGKKLGYVDLLEWIPYIDQDLTIADYDRHIRPIVRKVLRGESIYNDAYKLVYDMHFDEPLIESAVFSVGENMPAGTIVGQVKVLDEGSGAVKAFRLVGADAAWFDIDREGILRTRVPMDYETRSRYALLAEAENAWGKSPSTLIQIFVRNVPDSPELQWMEVQKDLLAGTAVPGTEVAVLTFNSGRSELVDLELGGADAYGFRLDLENGTGRISIARPLSSSMIGRQLELEVIPFNETDIGKPVPVPVVINYSVIRPGQVFRFEVEEGSAPGKKIGQVHVDVLGEPVLGYALEENDMFVMDSEGNVFLQGELDRKKKEEYRLPFSVVTKGGESESLTLKISVLAKPVLPVVVRDTVLSIRENEKGMRRLGRLDFTPGDSEVEYVGLLGEGNETFAVDHNGTVFFIGETGFDFEEKARHEFEYRVKDGLAERRARLTVEVVDVPDVVAVLRDFELSIDDRVPAGTKLGNLLESTGDSTVTEWKITPEDVPFTVDDDGWIVLREPLPGTEPHYRFGVTAISPAGSSDSVTVSMEVRHTYTGRIDTDGGYAWRTAFLPDRQLLFVALLDGGTVIYDLGTSVPERVAALPYDVSGTWGLQVTRDGRYAYTLDAYGTVHVFDVADVASMERLGMVDLEWSVMHLLLSPDEKTLYALSREKMYILDVTDPPNCGLRKAIPLNASANAMALSSDGRSVYVAEDGGIEICDASEITTFQCRFQPMTANVEGIAPTGDGRKMLVLSDGLQIFDVTDPFAWIKVSEMTSVSERGPILPGLQDRRAFLGGNALEVFGISPAVRPFSVASFPMGEVTGLDLPGFETHLFVSRGYEGVEVMDVSGPSFTGHYPDAKGFHAVVEADAEVGECVGALVVYDEGSGTIRKMELLGEGAENFTLMPDGTLCLAKRLEENTSASYRLEAILENDAGRRPVEVRIDVHGVPEIEDFETVLISGAKAGSFVGTLDTGMDDETSLVDISLVGEGSEKFTVERNGSIYVAPGEQLHCFEKPRYDLTVQAQNRFGTGMPASVTIRLNPSVFSMEVPGEKMLFLEEKKKLCFLQNDEGENGESALVDISVATDRTPTIESRHVFLYRVYDMSPVDGNGTLLLSQAGRLVLAEYSDGVFSVLSSVDGETTYLSSVIPSAGLACSVSRSYGLTLFDLNGTGTLRKRGRIDTYDTSDLSALADRETIALAEGQRGVRLVDIRLPDRPQEVALLGVGSPVRFLASSSDGMRLIVSSASGLSFYDLADISEPVLLAGYGWLNAGRARFFDDDRKVMVSTGNRLKVFDWPFASAPTLLGTFDIGLKIDDLCFIENGKKAYVHDRQTGRLHILDMTGL